MTATEVKFRRGTTGQHTTFTGASAEMTVDTSKNTLVVHDGTTAGGYPLALESSVNVVKASVSALVTSVSVIDTRVSALQTSVSVHHIAIAALQSTVSILACAAVNVSAINASIAANTSSIVVLQASVSALNTSVQANASSIVVLRASVSALNTSVAANASSIVVLQASVSALQTSVAANASTIVVLQTSLAALASVVAVNSASGGGGGNVSMPLMFHDGRLTLTSGSPIMTADVSSATKVYYTPYVGDRISLYSTVSSSWALVSFAQVTADLTGLTANSLYDVFGYNNSGSLALETLLWTSSTARATALSVLNGVYVRDVAPSRLYLGTIGITSTGQSEFTMTPAASAGGAANKLFVWNAYNRVLINAINRDSTDSWTYGTAAWRVKNNNTNNIIRFVSGLSGDSIGGNHTSAAQGSVGSTTLHIGIGYDSTTAFASGSTPSGGAAVAGDVMPRTAILSMGAVLGMHYIAALEYGNASGTSTFFGDGAIPLVLQGALTVQLMM